MKIRKLIPAIMCIMFLMSISKVYAFETQGTYTGTLTQNTYDPAVPVYLNDTYIGNYTDYYIYEVNLARNQQIHLTLEVPSNADFDLFVYTANESIGWGSYSITQGEDESLQITIPEDGYYEFVAADYSGSGSYTLRWETLTSPSPGASPTPNVSPSPAASPSPGVSPSPGASPSSQPILGLDPSSWMWIIAIIIIVIFVIIVVLLLKRRRKGMPPSPPPAYSPVPPPPALPDAQTSQSAPAPQTPAEPQQSTAPAQTEQPIHTCPSCGGQLTWIPEYQRWYCYRESKYA